MQHEEPLFLARDLAQLRQRAERTSGLVNDLLDEANAYAWEGRRSEAATYLQWAEVAICGLEAVQRRGCAEPVAAQLELLTWVQRVASQGHDMATWQYLADQAEALADRLYGERVRARYGGNPHNRARLDRARQRANARRARRWRCKVVAEMAASFIG